MPAQYSKPRSSDSAIILASALRSAASSAAVSPVTLLRYRRTDRLVLLTARRAGAALLVSVTLGTILRPGRPRRDVRAASPRCRNHPFRIALDGYRTGRKGEPRPPGFCGWYGLTVRLSRDLPTRSRDSATLCRGTWP